MYLSFIWFSCMFNWQFKMTLKYVFIALWYIIVVFLISLCYIIYIVYPTKKETHHLELFNSQEDHKG